MIALYRVIGFKACIEFKLFGNGNIDSIISWTHI